MHASPILEARFHTRLSADYPLFIFRTIFQRSRRFTVTRQFLASISLPRISQRGFEHRSGNGFHRPNEIIGHFNVSRQHVTGVFSENSSHSFRPFSERLASGRAVEDTSVCRLPPLALCASRNFSIILRVPLLSSPPPVPSTYIRA